MGNTICQSLLSKDSESLPLRWKAIYNQSNLTELLSSSKLTETIEEIQNCHLDKSIKSNVLKHFKERRKAYNDSDLERSLHGIRGLINPSILKVHKNLGRSEFLKTTTRSYISSSVDDFRLQIAYIIHTWSLYVNKELMKKDDEVSEDAHPVTVILDYFNEERGKLFKDKLLLMTVKLFKKEISEAIEKKNAERLIEYIDLFSEFMENLKEDKEKYNKIITNELVKGELFEHIKGSLEEFLGYLDHPNFELDQPYYEKLVNISIGSIEYITNVGYFLQILNLLLKHPEIGKRVNLSKLKTKILNNIKDDNEIFRIGKNPISKAKVAFTENGTKNRFKSKQSANNIVALRDIYILENYDRSKVVINKTNALTSHIPIYENDYRGPRWFYIFNGELHCYDSDNYYIGEVDMREFRTKSQGYRMDRYSSIRCLSEHDDNELEFIRTKWSWSYTQFFHFNWRERNKAIALKIYKNNNYTKEFSGVDKEEGEKLKSKFILTFLYYKKESSEYMRVYWEAVIRDKNGELYKGIEEENEENGRYKFSIYNEFIFMRNNKKIIVIHIDSCRVIGEQDIPFFDGYDSFEDKMVRLDIQTEELQIFEIENSLLYNRPYEVLLSKVKGTEKSIKRNNARGLLGIRENQNDEDVADNQSVEISDDEEIQEKSVEIDRRVEENLEEYERFLLEILEIKLRKTVLSKVEDIETTINKKNAKEIKALFYNEDIIEQKEELYTRIYKFLKGFRILKSNLESSTLIYILKTLQSHLEILQYLQKDPKCGVICPQITLKKILHVLENYNIDKQFFSKMTLEGCRKTINTITSLIIIILKNTSKTSIEKKLIFYKSKVREMLQDQNSTHTYEEFFETINKVKKILKKNPDEFLEFITNCFQEFSKTALKIIIPEELVLLGKVCIENSDLSKHRMENSPLQNNLNSFINTITSFGFYTPINDLFFSFLEEYFTKVNNFEEIQSKVKKSFEGAESSSQNKKIIKTFDSIFTSSLTGNIFSILVSMKEYSNIGLFSEKDDSELTESHRNLRHKMVQTFMGIIRIVNAYQKVADIQSESTEREEKHDISFTKNTTFLKKIIAKGKIKSISLCNKESMNEGSFINVFCPKTQIGRREEERRNIELLKSWSCENSHEELFDIDANEIYVTVNQLDDSSHKDVKITVIEYADDWKSELNFVNLAKICLSNISQNYFKELKSIKESGENSLISNLTQVNRDKLDKVLGSDLFEYGVDKQVFSQFDFKVDFNQQHKEIEVAREYKSQFLNNLGFSEETLKLLEDHCKNLQSEIERKSIYSKLGGELGYICNQAMFLTVLKHQSLLGMFVDDMEADINVETYSETWLKCTEIRTVSRNYHTLREIVDLFRKLNFLFSLEASETFSALNQLPTLDKGMSSFKVPSEGSRSRKSSLDIRKDGTDWSKVKNYLTALRKKKQEESPEDDTDLVSLIIKLIKIPIEVNTIIDLLEDRLHKFNQYTRALKFMKILYEGNTNSVLQTQIMNTFESAFRSDSQLSQLTQLTLNYNGLSNTLINEQISLVKDLVKNTVEFICRDEIKDEEIVLMALQNLKWMYKGRESDCVLAIDVQKIWKCVCAHIEKKYPSGIMIEDRKMETLIESTLELMEILMGYCVRKIQQQTLNHNEEDEPALGLRRHVSYIDENSITMILNKNLRVLITEVGKAVQEIDKINTLSLQEYKEFKQVRRWKNFCRNSASNYVNTYRSESELYDLSNPYKYTFDHKEISQPKTKSITRKKVITEKNEEGVEITRTEISIKNIPVEKKKSFKDFNELKESMKKVKAKDFKIVEKILIILYNNIMKIPETALQLLDSDENIKILLKLCLDSYPSHLQTIAINIVSELSKLTSFEIYSVYDEFLTTLKTRLTDKEIRQEPLQQGYYENLLRLTRDILICEDQPQAQKLAELLFQENTFENLELLFSILRPNQADFEKEEFVQGRLISLKSDIRNLKYILLSRNDPILYKEYIRRHHWETNPAHNETEYNHTRIVFENSKKSNYEKNIVENKNERFMIFKGWPVLCLITSTIKVVKQEEVVFETENPGEWKEMCRNLIKKFNVLEKLKKFKAEFENNDYKILKIVYKLVDVLQDYEFVEFYEEVKEIVDDYVSADEEFTFKITNEFGESLTNLSFENTKKSFRAVSSTNEKFKKFNSLLLKKSSKSKLRQKITTNTVILSKSLAAKEIIDTKVFLSFEDINSKDLDFCTKLIKKRIVYSFNKLKLSSNTPTFGAILSLWKNISTRASSFRKTKLETRLRILVDRIGDEDKVMQLLKTNLESELVQNLLENLESEKNLRNLNYIYEVVFMISKKVKTAGFFEELSYRMLTLISKLIRIYSPQNRFDDSQFSVILFINLAKHFKEFCQLLKNSKNPLNLQKESEEISTIFNLIRPIAIGAANFTIKLNDEFLYSVFNNLAFNIFLNCEIDLKELRKSHPDLVENITLLKFNDSTLKKDSELARDLYVLKRFFHHVHNAHNNTENREKLKCLSGKNRTIELEYGNDKPVEVSLQDYKNWVMAIDSQLPDREYLINVYSDPECKNRILGFTDSNYKSHDQIRTIYKEFVVQELPEITNDEKLYLKLEKRNDSFIHFFYEGNYYKQLRSTASLDFENTGSSTTDFCYNFPCQHNHMFVYHGCLHYFEDHPLRKYIKNVDGITMASKNFFYKRDTHEILVKLENYNNDSPMDDYYLNTMDSAMYSSLKSFKLPESLEVKSISGHNDECCFILFTNGMFGVIKSRSKNKIDDKLWNFLNKNLDGQIKIDTLSHGFNQYLGVFKLNENRILFAQIETFKDRYGFLQIQNFKTRDKILHFYNQEEKSVASINFKKNTVKDVMMKYSDSNYNYFILLENGELYHYRKDNSFDEKLKELFTINKKYTYKIKSTLDEFKEKDQLFERLHIKEAFGAYIDQITCQDDQHCIMVKYREYGDSEEIYQARISFDYKDRTSTNSDTKRRVAHMDAAEDELRYLRLTKKTMLPPVKGNDGWRNIYLNDIDPDSLPIKNHDYYDGQTLFDVRGAFIENCYQVRYPFVAFYDPVEGNIKGKNLDEEDKENLDMKKIVGQQIVKSKLKKLFEVFTNLRDDLNKEYEKFEKGGFKYTVKKGKAEIKKREKTKTFKRLDEIDSEFKKKEHHFGIIFNRPLKKGNEKKKKENIIKSFKTIYYWNLHLQPNERVLREKQNINIPTTFIFKDQRELTDIRVAKEYFIALDETILKNTYWNQTKDYFSTDVKPSGTFVVQGKMIDFSRDASKIVDINELKLDNISMKTTVSFYPNVYLLNNEEFKTFAKESAPLWFPSSLKLTSAILEKPLEELHEITKDSELKIPSMKEFLKNQDIIISKMSTAPRLNYCARVPSMFARNTYDIREFERLPNTADFNRDDFDSWFYAFACHNYKIIPFIRDQPLIEDEYWEKESFQKYNNIFGCFGHQLGRTYAEREASYNVNRFRGEKSTYEMQELNLLNQFYMENIKYFSNSYNSRRLYNFYFSFIGEPGSDAGGLKREYLLLLTNEIMDKLNIFIKSPNGVHNLGTEREKLVPDPKAVGVREMDNFYLVGFALGAVMRTGDIISVNLPSIFWKYLLNIDLQWEDIKCINHSIYTCLENIEKMPENELEYLDETFMTFLLDGSEVELKPNGKNIPLTSENKLEYINLVKEKNMTQLLPAFQKMKQGFEEFNYSSNLRFHTPKSIDETLVGMNYVDVEQLKKISRYQGGDNFNENHPSAIRFWRVLQTFNQQQLGGYLKYVWGRSRLSHGLTDSHRITYYPEQNHIPVAHTCFFELDLGNYENDEDLRKKLLYGIENCNEIIDGGNFNLAADFGT